MRPSETPLRIQVPPYAVGALALLLAPLLAMGVVGQPLLTAAGVVGLAMMIVLVMRPDLGLYLVPGAMLFDEINVEAGIALLGLGDLATFAMMPAWALHRLLRPTELRLPRGWFVGAIFLGWTTASLLLGVQPDIAYGQYARFVTYCVAMLAIVDLVREPHHLHRVLWMLAIAGTLQALIALPEAGSGRLGGLVEQPNALGVKLAFGSLAATGLLLQSRGATRVALGVALFLMLTAVALTMSRGAYIGLTVALVWWIRRQRRLVIAVALLVGGVVSFLDRGEEQRIELIAERFEMRDVSAQNRWEVALNAVKATAQHPFFGVGFGQFGELDQTVTVARQAGRGAHSAYGATAASSGIPALVLAFWFVLMRARDLRRRRDELEAEGTPEARRTAIFVSTFQAILLYQSVSLLVRGAKPSDMIMLGLCAAAAYVGLGSGLSPSERRASG